MVKKIDKISSYLLVGILLVFFSTALFARGPNNTSRTAFSKPSAAELFIGRSLSNIGNWAYWVTYDGMSGHNPIADASGGTYPRQTATAIFQDGFVWGGYVRDGVDPAKRVGGATYAVGTQAGYIVTPGPNPVAVTLPNAQVTIYRIRSDWRTLTADQVRVDAAEVYSVDPSKVSDDQIQTILQQYRDSWKDWPVDLGAPYIDGNNNGVYDPAVDSDGYPVEGPGLDYPGIANADQVLWYVLNDLNASNTSDLYGSPPMGLELQVTIWGYKQPGAALGQLIFKKYKFINKSGYQIDSMFVSQWCDPDLGNYSDDFVGCDTTLSLGYCYNSTATDADYAPFGIAPPAIGYDFFQGPLVKGKAGEDRNHNGIDDDVDYGISDLKEVGPGFINLPMTSFAWFAAGSDIDDPELGDYQGTLSWYNMLNGYIPTIATTPSPYLIGSGPGQGTPTKFPLAGDPVAGTGDLDGQGDNFPPGDRRMDMCSGPFTMAAGDTQEVVVAVVGGLGNDNLTSVTALKSNDRVAQKLYNDLFTTVPKPPISPSVKAVSYPTKVVLDWGFDLNAVAQTESKNPLTGYDFQGYNVYQLPSPTATIDQATRIVTYDLVDTVGIIKGIRFLPQYGEEVTVPVEFGTNSGIKRYIEISKDYIRDRDFQIGNDYYFAVTAYNFNPAPVLIQDKTLESSIQIIHVVPQSPDPGTVYTTDTGEMLDVTHSEGVSDGVVQVQVVDPLALTGDEYQVFFTEDTAGTVFWNLKNVTTGKVLLTDQPVEANIDASNAQPIVDGVQVKVSGPPVGFKSFQVVANANGPVDPPEMGTFAFNDNGFPLLYNSLYPDGTDRPDGARQQADGATWGFNAGGGDGSYASFLARTVRNDDASRLIPYDYEMRFTAAGGYANWAFTTGVNAPVPFELWNIGIATPDDPSDDYRMIPWVLDEVDEDNVYDYGTDNGVGLDSPVSGGDNDPYLDWVYWIRPVDYSPGTAGYDAYVAAGDNYGFEGDEVWARTILVNWNGGDVTASDFPANCDALLPEQGTVFRIITNKPPTVTDAFTFTSKSSIVNSIAEAKKAVEQINVFPNPYYAFNSLETNRFDRFVTFSHLPQKASIRIFDLGGAQVVKLDKNNTDQFMKWDLKNAAGLPVASGIYIVYIDMPDLGMNKTLKVFIVQSEQIIKYY